jgi:4-hydroxy 2-oxovalerate aldolase
LLTYLESTQELPITYRELSKVVSEFEELRKQHQWGTSLPYMFSGAKSLPQKQVMEWVGMNRYPLGCIINALNNQKQEVKDNFKLPVLEKSNKFRTAVVLGAGKTSKVHKTAVKKFIESTNGGACLVHAGARNIEEYLDVNCNQYYGLVGFESDKLLKLIGDFSNVSQVCVYPPFPRLMGITIPKDVKTASKELEAITFTNVTSDSPMALAIQIALDLGAVEIYLVGFDGYDVNINQNQFVIAQENQQIIDAAVSIDDVVVKTFTPTKYKNLEIISLYSLL